MKITKKQKPTPWPIAAERVRDHLTAEVEQLRAKLAGIIGAATLAKDLIVDLAGSGQMPNITGFATRTDAVYNALCNSIAVAKSA